MASESDDRQNGHLARILATLVSKGPERVASVVAGSSLAAVLIRLALIGKPQWFQGAARIGQATSEVSLSYLAGYVVYVLIEVWPRQRAIAQMKPAAVRRTAVIRHGFEGKIGALMANRTESIRDVLARLPDDPELIAKLSGLTSEAFLDLARGFDGTNMVYWTAKETMQAFVFQHQQNVSQLEQILPELPVPISALLAEVADASLISILATLVSNQAPWSGFQNLIPQIVELRDAIERLAQAIEDL